MAAAELRALEPGMSSHESETRVDAVPTACAV